MQDHLERPVSKNHRMQMSCKTVFGPLVPVELADRDHDSKKKDKTTLSSMVFYFNKSLEFIAEVPLHKWIFNPKVFVIYFCNYSYLSETLTHEIQGHGAPVQKRAWDSLRTEKKRSLILWVLTWWSKALSINACKSAYAGFTIEHICSSLTTLKKGEAPYMSSREETEL